MTDMALGFTQPLAEKSAGDLSGCKALSAREALRDLNLTAICEPIVRTIWDARHLTACYGDSFALAEGLD
jgi:hypothetical protein